MRRIAALLALTVGASLLAGCVYDPYTGTWQPCCNYYGSPYYRYPPPYLSVRLSARALYAAARSAPTARSAGCISEPAGGAAAWTWRQQ